MTLTDSRPVVLAGAGKMGLALAGGWLKAGLPSSRLALVDPKPSPHAREFAEKFDLTLTMDLGRLSAGTLVLAVKPQNMPEVLPQAKACISPDTLVISIAAGISLAALELGLASTRVIRTMPNTPAQISKGITGAVAGSGATVEDRITADALLEAAGQVVWFENEERLDALTAVSGSGPAYVFNLVEAMAAAGVAEGLSDHDAMQLARQTVIGAAALMEADHATAATLRENVTSPGGTTAAALEILLGEGGLTDLMKRAIHAARVRSEELGE